MSRAILHRVAILFGAIFIIAVSASAESLANGGSGRQWSVSIRGGATSGDGGEQPQFGALISYPGPSGLSYGLGVGYEQAYNLNIIPIFIDLRLSADSNKFLGTTPGLFFEAGYAAVFGGILEFVSDPSLGALRVNQVQGQAPAIDGEGYYLNFGVEMKRRLNSSISYVLEVGSKFQSIPPTSAREVYSNTGLSSTNQNLGGRILGGTDFDSPLSGKRHVLSSLSFTIGLRF